MAERVLLVGLERNLRPAAGKDLVGGFGVQASLDELGRLADTAAAEVAGQEIQRKERPDPATLIGRGKAEQIRRRCEEENIQTVIFDEPLTPAQQRNLENIVAAKIVDRTRLILDIFARRAHTREGILQVELAQLSYLLPRLTGRGSSLSQQVGGIGVRGPGERKLEYDRRRIRDRIALLKDRLSEVQKQRSSRRAGRHEVPLPVVALVGYTNAGKSTLLNRLAGEDKGGAGRAPAYADDKLFATLDPLTRKARLPDGRWALFTDTVGFVQKLPHELIAAFRATLEEARDADLLVHVIDATSPQRAGQERAVEMVLKELGVKDTPVLRVFNKADILSSIPSRGAPLSELWISALRGDGIAELRSTIAEALGRGLVEEELFVPYEKAGALGRIEGLGVVLRRASVEGGTRIRLRLDPKNLAWFKAQLGGKAA